MIEKKPTSTTTLACATMTTQCRRKASSKPVVAIEKAETRWDDEWCRHEEARIEIGSSRCRRSRNTMALFVQEMRQQLVKMMRPSLAPR